MKIVPAVEEMPFVCEAGNIVSLKEFWGQTPNYRLMMQRH
jgi:hypothetical protein